MNPVERAQELFAAGNYRAALNLLKPLAQLDNPPYEYRRALAELYRAMGCPDQAGRWGIAIEGWTTPLERDRLARLLASTGVGDGWVRQFLAVPPSEPDPADLALILDVDVPRYRAQFRRRVAQQREPSLKGPALAEEIAHILGVSAFLGGAGGLLFVFGATIVGDEQAQFSATVLLALVFLLAAAWLIALSWARLLQRQWALASVRFLWGLLAAAVGVGVIFFVAAHPL